WLRSARRRCDHSAVGTGSGRTTVGVSSNLSVSRATCARVDRAQLVAVAPAPPTQPTTDSTALRPGLLLAARAKRTTPATASDHRAPRAQKLRWLRRAFILNLSSTSRSLATLQLSELLARPSGSLSST